MMRALTLVLTLALGACATVPQAQPPVNAEVGVAFDRTHELASFADGIADPQSGRRVTPDDPVRVASVSKMVTTIGVMQLVEQGKLDLDKDVNVYLKDVKVPAAYDKPITLRDIMTHTSGFEEGFLGYLITNDPEKQIPIKEAMQRHMPARVRPPGVMSSYSNYATALAGLKGDMLSRGE